MRRLLVKILLILLPLVLSIYTTAILYHVHNIKIRTITMEELEGLKHQVLLTILLLLAESTLIALALNNKLIDRKTLLLVILLYSISLIPTLLFQVRVFNLFLIYRKSRSVIHYSSINSIDIVHCYMFSNSLTRPICK